jgi:phosphocarrier protein
MGVLMLAASMGTELTVETTGEDADQALQAVLKLINDGFGELQ